MEDESIGITATPTEKQQPKPPPIYIEAQVIEPLLELMKSIANDKYTLKQLKDYQVKVQVNTSEIYRKLTLALKEKNANFYTCQLKKNKSYKIVLRGVHPRTSTSSIINELKRHNHQVRKINNIVKHDTKQPQPLFYIELEPSENNKEIYKIDRLLNTVVSFEPPRNKRDIPQCVRCQSHGHTKNYSKRIPTCVKCAGIHWNSNSPIGKENIADVKCHNCQRNHPASYKGCTVRKQLQHKLFPKLRNKSVTENSNTVNQTVTTITNINNNIPAKTYQNTEPKKKTYAQVARSHGGEVAVSSSENQNFISDMLEMKKLLLALTKNAEIITNMLLQQTQVLLTQQSQQIRKMIELLLYMVNTLENNCYYSKTQLLLTQQLQQISKMIEELLHMVNNISK